MKKTMIRIAIQKSGRLNQESLALLKSCGISIDNGKDQLKAAARNFRRSLFRYPAYLAVDLAILGATPSWKKVPTWKSLNDLAFQNAVFPFIPKGESSVGCRHFQGRKSPPLIQIP